MCCLTTGIARYVNYARNEHFALCSFSYINGSLLIAANIHNISYRSYNANDLHTCIFAYLRYVLSALKLRFLRVSILILKPDIFYTQKAIHYEKISYKLKLYANIHYKQYSYKLKQYANSSVISVLILRPRDILYTKSYTL